MITREQAGYLTGFARTIRPQWDQLATINIIHAHQTESSAAIAAAVIAATLNPDARTPKAIDWPEHWQTETPQSDRPTPDHSSPRPDETCTVDGHSGWANNCAQCESEKKAINHDQPIIEEARI